MKDFVRKALSVLFLGGVKKSDFSTHNGAILEQNYKMFRAISIAALILSAALSIASWFAPALYGSFYYYLVVFIVALLSTIFFFGFALRYKKLIFPVIYFVTATILFVSIGLGTLSERHGSATMINVFLVLTPFMITDRPWRTNLLTVFAMLSFIPSSYAAKDSVAASLDMANVLCFGSISIFLAIYMTKFRLSRIIAISELKLRENTDVLTQLNFRNVLEQKILDNIKLGKTDGAVMLLDVDCFKNINDAYGHQFGDFVLVKLANQMQEFFADHNNIARLGGDEFMYYVEDSDDLDYLEEKAAEIVKGLDVTYKIGNVKTEITVSLGAVLIKDTNLTFEDIYRKADDAMYVAKLNGKNSYHFYTPKVKSKN